MGKRNCTIKDIALEKQGDIVSIPLWVVWKVPDDDDVVGVLY